MLPLCEESQQPIDAPDARESYRRCDTESSVTSTRSSRLSSHISVSSSHQRARASRRSFRDHVRSSTIFTQLGIIREMSRERWSTFSLFGVDRDDRTSRVWGNRVKASSVRRSSVDSGDGRVSESVLSPRQKNIQRSRSCALHAMVKQHTYHDEMRLQLRDERIRLTYLDAFETDISPGSRLVRVFSLGATLLEYLKIVLSVLTFVLALVVASFWDTLSGTSLGDALLRADLSVDVVFVLTLVVQLRTTILDVGTGQEFCTVRRIIHAHIHDVTFWMDVMSLVPLVMLEQIAGVGFSRVALVKALRGWRISRTPPEHLFVPSSTFILCQLTFFILMGGHLLACVWFTIVERENTMMYHIASHDLVSTSAASERYECLFVDERGCFFLLYTVSLHQGIYLLLGIDLDAASSIEHFLLTLCAPLGALIHAFMLGKIMLVIQRHSALETKQNEHTLAIQEAMRILGLPPNLQMRIIAFFTYERIHRSGRLFDALFTHLSPQLRFELQLHLYLDLVRKSGLFRRTRPRVIREIVVKLEDVIFLPGDWVCRYGDYGDSMFFMASGQCAIIDRDTVTELRVLEHGSYFGEVALLTGVPRTAYVRANTFCIMAQLTKDRFAPIVQKWPEEIDVLISGVEKEADRHKIKQEATKLYGLRRPSQASFSSRTEIQDSGFSQRSSLKSSLAASKSGLGGVTSIGPVSGGPGGTSGVGQSSIRSSIDSHAARLSVSSLASTVSRDEFRPERSLEAGSRPDAGRPEVGALLRGPGGIGHLWAPTSASGSTSCPREPAASVCPPPLASPAPESQMERLRHARSGPVSLASPGSSGHLKHMGPRRSHTAQFVAGAEQEEDPSSGGSTGESWAEPPVVQAWQGSTKQGGFVTPAPRRDAPSSPPPPLLLEGEDFACDVATETALSTGPVAGGGQPRRSCTGDGHAHFVDEEGPGSSTTAAEPECPVARTAPEPDTLIVERNQLLLQVQSQVSDMAQHVLRLQEEMVKQREVITESMHGMKEWAVGAVREALAQEPLHPPSRRISIDSSGVPVPGSGVYPEYGDDESVGMTGISTPFT